MSKAAWLLGDWLAFQEQQHTKAIDLGLERVRLIAQRLELDKPLALTITVAGTNGKGSSTATLSAIYTAAQYQTGWYSSPHLLNYNERICVNGQPVPDVALIRAFQAIEAVLGEVTLSYFEWGTLAALWLFRDYGCTVQILEVGLGGRLDAVNILDADAALITPIDLDHQAWLGSDRATIAQEKAGILRTQQIAVYADPLPEKTLLAIASDLNTRVFLPTYDYQWQGMNDSEWQWCANGRCLVLPRPALLGDFQLANAAGVLMLVEQLQARVPVTEAAIAQGLTHVRLIGRLDYRQLNQQHWLFDVAHNPQSISALSQYLGSLAEPVTIVAVFSALADKDVAQMVEQLKPWVKHWYVAPLSGIRAAPIEQLQQALASVDLAYVTWCDTVEEACQYAQLVSSPHVLRLVTGSFVTVEHGLRWLLQEGGC